MHAILTKCIEEVMHLLTCRHLLNARSASSAVSKYQPSSRTTHKAVYCWQPRITGCRSSSLEWSASVSRLIVIIADFRRQLKTHLFQLSYSHLIF